MEKEEILEKSRKENKNKDDELVLHAKLKASRFANFVACLLSIAFIFVAKWLNNEQAIYIICTLMCSMFSSHFFSLYWQLKRRTHLYFAIFEVAVALLGVVRLIWIVI